MTGKFNNQAPDSKRLDKPNPKSQSVVDAVVQMAADLGCTPSQVAIAWVRQQSKNIIPILGARTDRQLEDNLASATIVLSDLQLEAIKQASPIELGFPHGFLASDHIHNLIFGETYKQIDFS